MFRLSTSDMDLNLDVKFEEDESLWGMTLKEMAASLKQLYCRYFQQHCPWSWSRARYFRVLEARRMLEYGRHEKGWTASDTYDPDLHDAIARTCFVSRGRYWAKEIFEWLTVIPRLTLLFLVLLAYALYLDLRFRNSSS
ncbi:MAG: hypothetical protein KW788_04180 [Candidatus Doudnabacteria bacterium]|nr:hypothetical protein [Candidatus Doudnabacteria bacterium]